MIEIHLSFVYTQKQKTLWNKKKEDVWYFLSQQLCTEYVYCEDFIQCLIDIDWKCGAILSTSEDEFEPLTIKKNDQNLFNENFV